MTADTALTQQIPRIDPFSRKVRQKRKTRDRRRELFDWFQNGVALAVGVSLTLGVIAGLTIVLLAAADL